METNAQADKPKRIIRMQETCDRTGHGRATIYRKVADNKFPKPVKISDRAIGFVEAEIDTYITNLIAARDRVRA